MGLKEDSFLVEAVHFGLDCFSHAFILNKTDRQTTGRIYNSCYFLTIRDRAIENEKCFFIIKAVDDKG